jgi:hypothetical protein
LLEKAESERARLAAGRAEKRGCFFMKKQAVIGRLKGPKSGACLLTSDTAGARFFFFNSLLS